MKTVILSWILTTGHYTLYLAPWALCLVCFYAMAHDMFN